MKNLFAYNIDGSSNKKVGIDVVSWNSNQLSGSSPFVVSTDSTMVNYSKINSIENWEKFGMIAGLNQFQIKNEIKNLYESNTGTTWSAYTENEKEILAKKFIVDKSKRDEVLTQSEQDELNYYKIYDYLTEDAIASIGGINPQKTPKSIDYKKSTNTKLHPNYEFDNLGFLTGCTYYTEVTITQDALGFTQYNYSNPILRYTASYTLQPNGYVGSRTVTRKWYMVDGTLSDDSKITEKIYRPMEARNEGKRRRRNLINKLVIDTVGLIIMTSQDISNVIEAENDAIDFLKEVTPGINEYYEYGSRTDSQGNPCKLIQDINSSTYSRLDNFVPGTNDTVTIRQYLISKLSV